MRAQVHLTGLTVLRFLEPKVRYSVVIYYTYSPHLFAVWSNGCTSHASMSPSDSFLKSTEIHTGYSKDRLRESGIYFTHLCSRLWQKTVAHIPFVHGDRFCCSHYMQVGAFSTMPHLMLGLHASGGIKYDIWTCTSKSNTSFMVSMSNTFFDMLLYP